MIIEFLIGTAPKTISSKIVPSSAIRHIKRVFLNCEFQISLAPRLDFIQQTPQLIRFFFFKQYFCHNRFVPPSFFFICFSLQKSTKDISKKECANFRKKKSHTKTKFQTTEPFSPKFHVAYYHCEQNYMTVKRKKNVTSNWNLNVGRCVKRGSEGEWVGVDVEPFRWNTNWICILLISI